MTPSAVAPTSCGPCYGSPPRTGISTMCPFVGSVYTPADGSIRSIPPYRVKPGQDRETVTAPGLASTPGGVTTLPAASAALAAGRSRPAPDPGKRTGKRTGERTARGPLPGNRGRFCLRGLSEGEKRITGTNLSRKRRQPLAHSALFSGSFTALD